MRKASILKREKLEKLLSRASQSCVAVVGDFCLDAYWEMEWCSCERSVETGLPIQRVRAQRYSPGGAGNVAANLRALGASVSAIGLCGKDPFGAHLRDLLMGLGVDCTHFQSEWAPDWQTPVYAKPMRMGREGHRIDFGAVNEPEKVRLYPFRQILREIATTHDALIVNSQLEASFVTHGLIDMINDVAHQNPSFVVMVDARRLSEKFREVFVKINEKDDAPGLWEPDDTSLPQGLERHFSRPAFLTRGEAGMQCCVAGEVVSVPAVPVEGPIDTVGAGDTTVAALASTLPSVAYDDREEILACAQFANLAASVTVRKIATTGTASPDEIRAAHTSLFPNDFQ